jgi:hypothetical protein
VLDLQHKLLFLQAVKFLFGFLALFLLYLSCIPCSDKVECNTKTEVRVSSATNHQEHNPAMEICTPFCTCSCCPASAFYSPFNKIQATKIVFQPEKFPFYDVAFTTQAYYSIWQPPKLKV